MIAGVSGYMGLLEFGVGQAVLRQASIHVARNEGRTLRALLVRAVLWFMVTGALGSTVIYLLTPWIVRDVLRVPIAMEAHALSAFHLGAIAFAVGMPASVLSVVPQAFLRYDVVAANSVVLASLSNIGPALLVLMGYGLVPVAAFAVLVNVATLVSYSVSTVRLVRGLDADAGPGWGAVRRDIYSFAGVTAASRTQSVVAQQTSKLVVGVAGGVALAGYYQVPYVIADRLNDLAARVGQVLFPHAAHMIAVGDMEGTQALYLRAARLLSVLNAATTAGVFAFAFPILRFWVGMDFAKEGAAALGLLVVTQAVNAVCIPASYVNMALGRAKVNFWFALANSCISLALVYPLTTRFGLAGAAAAGLAGCTAVPAFLIYSQWRVLGLRSWSALATCYLPSLFGAAAVGLTAQHLLSAAPQNLILTLCLVLVVSATAVVAIGLLGGLRKEDASILRSSFFRLSGAP